MRSGKLRPRRTHQLKVMVSEAEFMALRRIADGKGGIAIADVIRMWLHEHEERGAK